MRVLMVTDGLWNGGAERQMTLLAASLPAGYEVLVASLADGPYAAVLRDTGIAVEVVPRRSRFDVTPAPRLWKVARAFRPDIVHTWGWMSSAAALPYCRLSGTPLLDGTIRRGRIPPKRPFLNQLMVRLADKVVANTHAGLESYGVPEDKGRVVYNGFDPDRLPARGAEPTRAPSDVTSVVMTGRMYPEKDWTTFVEAARRLSSSGSGGWRFIAVGDGPELETVLESASDLVEAGVMAFPDGGTEVMGIVCAADAGVLLTDTRIAAEGCSNSLMEYMACGLPVVATDAGGNPELVLEGETGLLVPGEDADALVGALAGLRADRAAARAMGEAGRERLAAMFSVERMVADFVDVYAWVTS